MRRSMIKPKTPFFVVNPKSYLFGKEIFEFALKVDEIADELDLQIYFTCPYTDIRHISNITKSIVVCAQSMDSIIPGRGMGLILPESLRDAGAKAVFLNHAENKKTVSELNKCIQRTKELDMISIVCADSPKEANAIACMNPDIIVAEPTDKIGTGKIADDSYIIEVVKSLHRQFPNILVNIASGISTAEDCYHVIRLGADGTGATSGILTAKNPVQQVREMAKAVKKASRENTEDRKSSFRSFAKNSPNF